MSGMQRTDLMQGSAAAAIFAALFAVAFLVLIAEAHAGAIVSKERAAGKRAVERYWTPKRMEAARPLEATVSKGKLSVRRGSGEDSSERAVPAFESGPVAAPESAPNAVHGKLYGKIRGIGKYECSATSVNAANRSVIVTAGHCVSEPGRGFAKKLAFVPAYQHGHRPFGTWVFRRTFALRSWKKRGNFNFDFAAVAMSPRDGRALEDVVGGLPLLTKAPLDQSYVATGYPANKERGKAMWRCSSQFAGTDPHPVGKGPRPIGMGCDMGVGASGGGWTVNGALNSVSSFGYGNKPVLYGPYFGQKAAELHAVAANR